MPNTRAGLKTPFFSRVAATMGTVELTGLEMTRMWASGETRATAAARSRTIDAFVCFVVGCCCMQQRREEDNVR